MKRVRIVVSMAAPSWAYQPGDEVELNDADAEWFVLHGRAEYIEPEAAAVVGGRERAVTPRARARRG